MTMSLSLTRFSLVVFAQLMFLLIDLVINSYYFFTFTDRLIVIFVYLFQDICLLLSFTLFIVSLYQTYIYQAGLADLLYSKFRAPLIALTLYFFLCVSHHIWIVMDHSNGSHISKWPGSLTALFLVQRIFAPIYYYLYKRSALRMSDPKFYDNIDWINEHLAIK